jgi:hypothetical protein
VHHTLNYIAIRLNIRLLNSHVEIENNLKKEKKNSVEQTSCFLKDYIYKNSINQKYLASLENKLLYIYIVLIDNTTSKIKKKKKRGEKKKENLN